MAMSTCVLRSISLVLHLRHRFEDSVKRKLRMEQHRRCEEKIQFAKANGRSFVSGDAPDPRQKILDRAFPGNGMEHDPVGILETESDNISFLQLSFGNSLPVQKNTKLISAVLQKVMASFVDDRSAIAGDAPVGDGKLVSRFAAANQELRLRKR